MANCWQQPVAKVVPQWRMGCTIARSMREAMWNGACIPCVYNTSDWPGVFALAAATGQDSNGWHELAGWLVGWLVVKHHKPNQVS